MTFYGLEQPIDYGRQLVFDPSTAEMVLNAQRLYANAVYNDYKQGLAEMEDFKKNYAMFMTPIAGDQDWWNEHVTGRVRNIIDSLYAQGIDPLRTAEGRAIISLAINSMPYGDMAKMQLSAENAKEFLKAKQKLQAEGKWNSLLDPYDGPNLSDYSTLESGVWDRVSPTPYENMADFSKAYFDNIKPFKTSASKNGITYTKSEISMDDLRRIARQHHNDLVNTPQGQMMYKYYKDLYGSDEAARNAFDEAVVSGNVDRLYYEDDYNDNWLKKEGLRLQQEDNNLARDRFNWEKYKWEQELKQKQDEKNNPNNGDNGRNYYQDLFDRGLNFFTYGREGMPAQTAAQDAENGRNVLKVAQESMKSLNALVDNEEEWAKGRDAYLASKVSKNTLSQKVLVESSGREVDKSKSHTVFATAGDVDRLYSDDNVVATTFGGVRNSKTRKMRTQDNSDLAKYKDPSKKLDDLKILFTDLTYTAPITGNDGKVRMTLFQRVNLYDNHNNQYIGTKWYKVLESDPTGAFVEKRGKTADGRPKVTRLYVSVPTTLGLQIAGEMQYNATEAEHVLHSTAEGKYNSLTRY